MMLLLLLLFPYLYFVMCCCFALNWTSLTSVYCIAPVGQSDWTSTISIFNRFFFYLNFLSLLYGLWWKFSITIFSCNINDLPFAHTIRLFIYLLTLPTLLLLLLMMMVIVSCCCCVCSFFPRQLDYYQINLMCTHFRD